MLLSGFILVQAQHNPRYIFDHLTVEEGLSQSTVFAITMDADGYLWFGTRDGLSRYDSKNIKVYRNKRHDPNSLSGNSIQCLFVDSKKTLWVATNDGISTYDPRHDNFIQSKLDTAVKERLSVNFVTAILEDKEGTIWIATHGGLNKVISRSPLKYQNFRHHEEDPRSLLHDEVRTLYEDESGNLWVGTSQGVSRLIRSGNNIQFQNFRLPTQQLKGKSWINCLTEDDKGNILIGTEENGIKVLHKESGTITGLHIDEMAGCVLESVRSFQRNGRHEFWIGTIDGLFIYNDSTQNVISLRDDPANNTTLNDNSVRSIFKDPYGMYWIGTFYGGVNSYSPLSRQFGEVVLTNKKNQKAYKVAGAMVTDKNDNLWVGTDGNGLYCLNRAGETIGQFRHMSQDPKSLSHNKIKSLLLDDDGIWVGTINGLNFLDFKTGKFRKYFYEPANPNSLADDRIYDIKKDSDGYIWIATYRGGLCRFDKSTQHFKRFAHQPGVANSLSSDAVTYVLEDTDKNLWIGTISGLNKKPVGKNTFVQYGNHAEENQTGGGDYILCIYEDSRRNLWVGTRDTGLKLILHGSSALREFTTEHGLPGNNVNGILEDASGCLWLSTDNGLSKFNPDTFKFKNYNKSDGLVCNEFNFNSFHKDNRGFLFFGGYNGIVKFRPESIHTNNIPPTLVFTKLKVFNEEVQIDPSGDGILTTSLSRTSDLTFNFRQNIFSVEFAALSYINSGKNQYAYKLEGFEDQWNYVGDPVATYMNLQPGDYTLVVTGANNDGLWNNAQIRLNIHVLPPPWKTWWAYTIYSCIILGLLLALIRFNKMRWKLAHDLKIEHLEKEQQEKLHRAKLNFFTNIAHEIRTPLTLIVSPVEVVGDRYAHDVFIQRQLRIVKSNTTRLMRLINQLLDFQKQETGIFKLKMHEGNIVELLRAIVFSFSEHAKARHINLEMQTAYREINLPFDRDELEKVFCNLLHNAFKFTPGGGNVLISVSIKKSTADSETDSFVQIQIEDTGIGIPSEDLPKIFNRFFQVGNDSISESGFGIGLALTKGIINLHGGSITAESMEAESGHNGFTKFTILLPLPAPESIMPPDRQNLSVNMEMVVADDLDAVIQEKSTPSEADRNWILVIEDNAEIRNCLTTILSPSYNVIESINGADGWNIATRRLPDLVVCDIAMPEMDGLEFTRLMKSDERTSHIPVILLTARGAMEHHVEGMETGADDYVTKPFHARILQLKVRNLLVSRERLREKYRRIVTLEPACENIADPDNTFLGKLKYVLEANLNDPDFNVTKLVNEIGMSRPVLFRKIKMLTGLSVIDLIRSTRLKKAEMLLRQKKMNISEVAFTVGFNDPKYFSKSFRAQFGKTPTEFMDSM
jgi:ligand-binding sensor domain-containing protein/CheY-like chemotaxis protein